MAEQDYNIPNHAAYDLGEEILKTSKRRKRARKLIRFASFVIAVFVIISYLGYTLGQYFANATSLSVRTKMPEIAFSQLGFRLTTPIDATDSTKYNLVPDTEGDVGGQGYVYWSSQDVSPQTLSFILKHEKYSHNSRLMPVTSRFFVKDQDKNNHHVIYDRPRVVTNVRHNLEEGIATKEDYMGLSVLFRLGIDNDPQNTTTLDNIGVYFSRDTKFNGDPNLLRAMRLGFQSSHTKDIISPGRKEPKENGYLNYINVGGRLDLDAVTAPPNRYGYYDYTLLLDGAQYGEVGEHQYEIAYGDFENELTNANWGEASAESGTIPENNNVYHAATFANVRPLINAVPAKQYYTNFAKYSLINGEGDAIAFTNEIGVAEVNLSIWLEGWDEYATDDIVGSTFGAQLKFEVAKKDLIS